MLLSCLSKLLLAEPFSPSTHIGNAHENQQHILYFPCKIRSITCFIALLLYAVIVGASR